MLSFDPTPGAFVVSTPDVFLSDQVRTPSEWYPVYLSEGASRAPVRFGLPFILMIYSMLHDTVDM